MTKIRPFKAITYNQQKLKDLSKVVCPPYDVISPAACDRYHDTDSYNFIHILLGRDVPGEDKYKRAASYFKDWTEKGILTQDKASAVYFYSHQYNIKGEKRTRFGFIALLRLGDKDSAVFAHEHTRLEPKEDRLKLLKQVKANLSPIFIIFPDKKRIIQRIFQLQIKDNGPFIEVVDEDKSVHKLWRIDSPEVLAVIQAAMEEEDAFIADGHHRYEVACAYRDEMKEKLGARFSGEEDFNYVLAYFTNTDPRGLSILPIHRLLKLDAKLDLDAFKESLKEYFDVEEVKDKNRFFFLMEVGGRTEHVLGIYKDKKYFLVRLKNIKTLDKLMSNKPKEYRSLDVCILNTIILEKILGIDPVKDKDRLIFSPHANDLIEAVEKDPAYIAFFLNPVKMQQIMNVALGGNKMPPKSTYFYPKVLSGLLINKLEEKG